ncbi:hypothetical protein GALMADRAFT_264743 [Galerina marginata CBS 339.88]|uniref:Wings apart-like protein C-terminal domain-containing protein n=1 Tax=Galerina marginata (strain CBS 339.88) TaxID=685588 RepID=A0A067TC35_GALM3|nr:hypothetical protein GALMADRAFT_264743 [Galerina marginata CBS 339.88]
MMSAAGSGSGNLKTYGKRNAMKRKPTKDFSERSPPVATAKRRKLSAESVVRTPSPHRTEEDDDTEPEGTTPEIPKGKVPYGSPRGANSVFPSPQHSPSKPSKPAKDLSVIFEDIAPSASSFGSPSKLAKRMLSRSKTESSIEGMSKSQEGPLERTPSLPNLPPSPSKNQGNIASTSKPIPPLLPLLSQGTNKSITRTYAGKFRSFLVPLPASLTPNDPLSVTLHDDESDTRESYSSLRNRWGVDNSEDDPNPFVSPSPTKSNRSNLSTPDISPSRKGKGKATYATGRPPLIPSGMMNPLKSISELRNKGESRRFLDEVGYLFEGMDRSGGIGLRRASALEITTKLCDPDFTRKAKAADFFTRTWDLFLDAGAGQGEDKILDILLVFFASLVARDPASLLELAQRSPSTRPPSPTPSNHKPSSRDAEDVSFIGILFSILDRYPPHTDPLVLAAPSSSAGDPEFKKAGINRKDRLILTTVYKTISSKANLFSPEVPISTSLLISDTLQSLPPSMIPAKFFPTFLNSFRLSLSSTPSYSLSSSLSIKWNETARTVPFENVYCHLLLLDTYLLDQWEPPPMNDGSQSQTADIDIKDSNDEELDRARDSWLAEDLVALGLCVEINLISDDSGSFAPQRCLDTALRVLVSLTHANRPWGRRVVQSEFTMGWLMRLIHKCGQQLHFDKHQVKVEEGIKLEETERHSDEQDGTASSHALDTLCLALGLLTNLVQIVEEAKQVVHDTRLNPSCALKKRICARKCTCPQPSFGIEILAQLYSRQQIKTESFSVALSEDSPEARAEADASFLRGHLAVLFGLLMIDHPENQSAILSALPSLSPSTMSSNARSQKAAKRAKMSRLVEQAKDFAAFYTAVSKTLGGDKESKVAKDVVSFLETQRDSFF